MNKVIHKELSYSIVGILFKIHNELGRYRNEKQYCDYIELNLKENKINYEREKILEINVGKINNRSICDFIIDNKIIIEVKTKNILTKDDYFQIKRYLSTSKLHLGLLVNFRDKFLNPKRILNNKLQV